MRIGIDFGGTKTEAIALDDAGEILARERRPTPRGDYEATVALISDMTLDLEKRLGQSATVGVGIPGAISPATGLVKNANSTWCNGKAFDADLGRALNREVRMNNDANCLAVSEATDGAAAGAHLVFAIILGTGVGGGIAIDGKPHVGRLAIGGEWGHNPLPWPREDELPGPQCFCGRRGCIERYCSGPGFAEDFLRVTGRELSSADIISGMRNGDAECSKAFERYVDRLARGLSHVINIIDPDAVVLGGGMSNVDELYDAVPPKFEQYVLSDVCDTPVRKAKHGDSSGVRGAAWLW